ncbi:Ldh family oxidoreductase [Noviherbaspirillum sp.]|uniref:Ldh family oxidoreductase n=1 Tax=Noviherbaspirillum sp. TaxID=1926288 RepID=UPI002FE137E1
MRLVQADLLKAAMGRAFNEFNLPQPHITAVCEALISMALDGNNTHGVKLFTTYLEELRVGSSNPNPLMVVTSTLPAVAVLDADHALGVVAASHALNIAIERSKIYGIAAVAVQNSNHFGAASYYAKRAAQENFIGLVSSNSESRISPINGGISPHRATPLAIAVPSTDESFCIDMATSPLTYSMMMQFLDRKLEWQAAGTEDVNSHDVQSSNEVMALEELQEYKEQGLGMIVQILCTLLSNMPFNDQFVRLDTAYDKRQRGVGYFLICVNIDGFTSGERFCFRTSQLLNHFRNNLTEDSNSLFALVDGERRIRRERVLNGIPLDDNEWAAIGPYL